MSNLLLPLLILIIIQCTNVQCIKSNKPGIAKLDRRTIRVGENATITCSINFNLKPIKNMHTNSTHLTITPPAPQHMLKIINESTIKYTIINAMNGTYHYKCILKDMIIDYVTLTAGYAPLEVTDFKCQSYDFVYMECRFTKPSDPVPSYYNLTYRLEDVQFYICDLILEEQQFLCNITFVQYRDVISFELFEHNEFANNTQKFRINHYEIVKPAKPELNVREITKWMSAELEWQMIMYDYYNGYYNNCKKSLEYEVFLHPANFDWINYTNKIKVNNKEGFFKMILRDLPYAYHQYDVRVRQRVTLKNNGLSCIENGGGNWSEPSVITFKTLPRVPDAPPATDMGSFYINPTEQEVHLYWEPLPTYRENAANFSYKIISVLENGLKLNSSAKTIVGSSESFSWKRGFAYEFAIKSSNVLGDSAGTSIISVPAMTQDLVKSSSPDWVRTIYNTSNRTYTLSWNAPTNLIGLQNYTIFWCPYKAVTQKKCQNTSIHFTHVDKYQTNYSSPVQETDNDLYFAISANYVNFTTGMVWTMCVSLDSEDLIQLEPEIGKVTSKSIEIKWSLGNMCRSLLEGFIITYCELVDNYMPGNYNEASCLHDQRTTINIDKTKKNHSLEELKPHTFYKIEMIMYSKMKVGKVSDGIFVATKEDAPSPPRQVNKSEVTSNSAVISWSPPEQHNGIIRHYTINVNTHKRIVNCSQTVNPCNQTVIQYNVENLSSYTNYTVNVRAHTVLESKDSNNVYFTTKIGIPSTPRYMEKTNESIFKWVEPEVPAGRLDYYEVLLTTWFNETVSARSISAVYDTQACKIKMPSCENKYYKHTLQVRAVNMADRELDEVDDQLYRKIKTDDMDGAKYYTSNDNMACLGLGKSPEEQQKIVDHYRNEKKYVLFKSEWGQSRETLCADSNLSYMASLSLVVVISSLIAMTTFYFVRLKYLKMSEISIKLPGELEVVPHYTIKTRVGDCDDDNIGGNGVMSLGSAPSAIAPDIMRKIINGKMDRDMDYHRSKECLYQPESHHLLAPITFTHSGYNDVVGIRNNLIPCSIGNGNGYEMRECSFGVGSSAGRDTGSCETIITPLDDHPGYQLMEQSTHNNYQNNNKNNNNVLSNSYVQPKNIISDRNPKAAIVPKIVPAVVQESLYDVPRQINHYPYLLPDGANNETAVGHNGYIPSHLLPQKANVTAPKSNSIEYTTLESLKKIPNNNNINNNNNNINNNNNNNYKNITKTKTLENDDKNNTINTYNKNAIDMQPISGYVTQGQLSVFGQHQQQQKQQQIKQQQQEK